MIKIAHKGFTLMEIMISVVIIAVVAAVGVPSYRGVLETARAGEACIALAEVYRGQKIYYANNNAFWGGDPSWANNNAALGTNITNTYYDINSFWSPGGQSYTIILKRNAVGRSAAGTKTFTMTYANG